MEVIEKDMDLRFSQMSKKVGTSALTPSAKVPANNTKAAPNKAELKTNVEPKKLYEQALSALKDNKLDESELKFSQFLSTYPKDALAENAQYWLGEVYYKKQDFAKAAVAFNEGYSKYPEGSKGPDCLLKLGLSMKALGKNEEACTAFTNLPTIFGKVNPEIATRATDEAKKLSCK
jgi:tol-pal system protein YbgF